ncbi:Uncharacterised protein [Mycobacteroides abscessus subsp. abscessus]|nr:Uncharacterised protein [Mycobacteroides abscessus subsp. abscessus]SHW81915.1 Uncharacterised protein [Mycobacteroides abscessus subsp. abscessus]SKV39109.1 Uncharacterised protein [Mycobacteroides abscessus subsp. abscessus]
MSVSVPRAVSISTGMGAWACTWRHTSSPSSPGSMTSSTIRSGGFSRQCRTASRPLSSVSTAYPSARSRAEMDAQIVGSSSTTKILRWLGT